MNHLENSSVPELLVIADDLTGACDAGGQCARLGIPSLITTDPLGGFDRTDDRTTVLIVDTDSRHASPEQAFQSVLTLCQRFRAAGGKQVYKKTDSTLRGNIGVELAAVCAAMAEERILFVPAYPEAGRTTLGGVHYVDGKPLHESPFGVDPRCPVISSNVREILSPALLPVTSMSTPGSCADQKGIIAFDAVSAGEVAAIAKRCRTTLDNNVLAGPVGFFGELLRGKSFGTMATSESQPFLPLAVPALVVCGSLHPVSLAQCAWALGHGAVSVSLDEENVVSVDFPGDALVCRCGEFLQNGETVLVHTVLSPQQRFHSVSSGAVSRALGKLVAAVVERYLNAMPVPIIIFGGETSRNIFSEMGAKDFVPQNFLDHGITVIRAQGLDYDAPFVTKSGGFGAPDCLGEILRASDRPIDKNI